MAKGNRTFLEDLVDPEVLADMVSGKVDKLVKITPFAKIDNTLSGRAGSTITVPYYGHIGNAVVVAEGDEIPVEALSTSTKDYKVHKIGKGITITDEAVLSGYGDPVTEGANQLARSIAQEVDQNGMDELLKADQHYFASTKIKYTAVVDGIGVFNEEANSPKIMFINPAQVTDLRKDPEFISADKYGFGTNVMMTGEIGMIANTRIVVSKRVALNKAFYKPVESGTTGAKTIVANTATPTTGEIKLEDVKPVIGGYEPKVGDVVLSVGASSFYVNPIVRIVSESEVDTGIPALTIYTKRDVQLEIERQSTKRQSVYTVDKHYVVALTNASEVVLLYVNK